MQNNTNEAWVGIAEAADHLGVTKDEMHHFEYEFRID